VRSKKREEELVVALRKSKDLIGAIYPVIVTKEGEIIVGKQRMKADSNWPKTIVEADPIQKEIMRVHENLIRKTKAQAEEYHASIMKVKEELLRRGVEPTQEKIAEVLGVSQQWVSKYYVLRDDILPRHGKSEAKTEQKTLVEAISPTLKRQCICKNLPSNYFSVLENLSKTTGKPVEELLKLAIEHYVLTVMRGSVS